MLDLSFGLPITVRDAALKMVAPGPNSSINREYYAQEHERELEEGRGAVEEYDKTDEKARDLLRRLANSEPYYKKQRRLEASGEAQEKSSEQRQIGYGPGPVRTQDSKRGGAGTVRSGRGGARGGRSFPSTAQVPPSPADILPPADTNITSLFVTGVEDDLPEHALRSFFTPFGTIRSLICSHRSHCAFINYADRESAEKAADQCQGRAVVQGCPLRVQWGKPKPLDNLDREERLTYARQGRQTAPQSGSGSQKAITSSAQADSELEPATEEDNSYVVAPPPGAGNVTYASLAGD